MDKIEVDVLIVGGGSAGLSAAVAAAEKGAKVAVFQKEPTLGGNGNRGMGMFAVESRLQREQNVTLTREEAFREMMAYNHWQTDARVTRAFIERSADTIDWLLDMGVQFGRLFSYFPTAHPTEHDPVPPETPRFEGFGVGTMGGVMAVLDSRADELGVQRYLETPVHNLVKAGRRVCGVLARDKNGREIEATAGAVIIATGGFGENREWVKKYTGFDLNENMFVVGRGGVMGEGIQMAWDAGADTEGMIMQMINVIIAPGGQPIPIGHPLFNRSYNLLVNTGGRRFMTEEEMKMPTFFGNQLARQKGACGFSIIDGTIADHFKSTFDPGELFGPFKLDFEPLVAQFEAAGSPAYCAADSLEALAAKTGVDLTGLEQTIAEYNADCEAGKGRRHDPPDPAALLCLPVRARRLRHVGGHQDQPPDRSARQKPGADSRPVCGGGGRQQPLQGQLRVLPLCRHHGLCHQQRKNCRRKRGGIRAQHGVILKRRT